MDSSILRRNRFVRYTLIGIVATSLMGLCMLSLAVGIHLSRSQNGAASVAVKPDDVNPRPTRKAALPAPQTDATAQSRLENGTNPPRSAPSPSPSPTTLLAATPAANTPQGPHPEQATDQSRLAQSSTAHPIERGVVSQVENDAVPIADEPRDVPSVSDDPVRLAYQWSATESSVYEFSGSAEIGSRTVSLSGRNTLQPTGRKPTESRSPTPAKEGTGSGFLVTADGIVVTCAHVIDGATSIKVVQDRKSYEAEVVAIDDDLDLAVLKIQGPSFPFLKIGDSDRVRLADEVRAVGFPLSDVLGESVKVTRGEVSGRGGPHGSSGLQIDASINPGNSGGPVIDRSGHVIGVANALLAGLGISEVGFAIPAKEVASLAHRHQLPVTFDDVSDVLPPPDLVAKVSPAVVLLKVTHGPGGIGSKPAREIKITNFWTESTREQNSGAFGRMAHFQPPQHANFSGAAFFDALGQVSQLSDQSALPYLLGNAAAIGVERLPDQAPGRINEQRVITIEINPTEDRSSRFGPYAGMPNRVRPPWMRSSPPRGTPGDVYTGTESSSVSVGAQYGDIVDVTKNYELRVPSKSGEGPDMIKVVGQGTGHFNLSTGQMKDFQYHAEIVISEGNITLRIPTELRYSLVSKAKLAEERAKAKAARIRSDAARLAEREKRADLPGSAEFHAHQSIDASLPRNQNSALELSINTLGVSSNLDQLAVSDGNTSSHRSDPSIKLVKVDVTPTNDAGSIRQFRSGSWGYKGLAFTPDGSELVTFGNQNVSVLNVQTGQSEMFTLEDNEARFRTCVAVSPDGSRIAGGTQGGYVLIWKRMPGKPLVPEHRFKIDKREVKAIAISSDNTHVLTAHAGGDAYLWELASGEILGCYRGFKFSSTAAVRFTSDDEQALICDTRHAVLVDVQTLKPLQKMELTRGSGQSVAISLDGKRISAGEIYKMESWDPITGQKLPLCEGTQIQWSAAFSPNGKHLLTGSSGKLTLWDVDTGLKLKELTMSDSGYVKYVAFSPDGRHCAAVGAPIGSLVEVFQLPSNDGHHETY
ncbi:trypsin-like peptidase domain-containing protein [Allorhodopirellula heiligendammensis]|uniref:Serine protease HhoB n=1 Tax=Allorhodopirellula heiligendammensis TaxID=2714739 RepID=A0A5C6BGY5_9BACT|nr:trypsin-like peptidase domain-containing protein [Allorhodopirellula heiligendammensis]TWU10761.1 putative serine protease HhoB precursor [Allorhodopirellula heiligendammensis]